MSSPASDIRHTATPEWSLGAVLAEREIDERTWLLVVRGDAGLAESLALGRRLLGLHLASFTTIVVDVGDAHGVTDMLRATLVRCRRKLAARDGRLVVAAERPVVRRALALAGLEVADDFDDR